VRERIARALVYPAAARSRGWEGRVVVAFTLLRDGRVREVRVVATSGFGSLDRSAIAAVLAAAPFPAPAEELEITTPVLFRLD
jgi:protein TonB